LFAADKLKLKGSRYRRVLFLAKKRNGTPMVGVPFFVPFVCFVVASS